MRRKNKPTKKEFVKGLNDVMRTLKRKGEPEALFAFVTKEGGEGVASLMGSDETLTEAFVKACQANAELAIVLTSVVSSLALEGAGATDGDN